MKASETKVMTKKLITIAEGSTLFEADELMKSHRIRHLPVENSKGELIGLISQRDLQYISNAKNLSVEMFMTSPVHFVTEETPLSKVIYQMLEKKISCVLVADSKAETKGIITTDDLLWYLSKLIGEKESKSNPFWSPKIQLAIGEVANELSQMGI